jgi:AraC-like DNA-binding protein
LTATKMNYVMYLLEKTDLTVSEISHICDMSATNLIRCFKKYYQITPAQYRKSYKKDMV